MHTDGRSLIASLAAPNAAMGGGDFARKAARSLAPVFRASRAVFSDRQDGRGAVHFVNWPAWCQNHYCRYVRSRDPIRGWLDSIDAGGSENVARLSDLAPVSVISQTAFADRLMSASGAGFVLTIALRDGAQVLGALSLVRDIGEKDFSTADCELAYALSPILEMAYRGARGMTRDAVAMPASGRASFAARLTAREREVAELAAVGHDNKTIARTLDASPWTVKNHLRAVFRKTGVRNRTELARALD